MITKVLIANRGEIACRIIDSVQAAGYDAVAVHSDADSQALFTALADEAVSLGGNSAAESYLDMDKIFNAAKATGADAIHPGYGFLSENADFAARCKEEGIIFIGPSEHAIRVMGNKAAAKNLMLSSGVPCIPGYQGDKQDDDTLRSEAQNIGFPLMIKAAAGGGGRGIRLVNSLEEMDVQLASARKESLSSFGSDELILEKAIVGGRHIEIQIAADRQGNIVHLFERDCSVQRRHQKVIEEAPSPFMNDQLRREMGLAAINAARVVDYEGVGTVEFLVDADQHFYFLEMNTRLQVEHPVTELITGVDIVDWQLQIAEGEQLPLDQADLSISGHSIEVRIYAEDPANGFMPQTGRLSVFEPSEDAGIRIDHGIYPGAIVTPYYDAMLAKVIAWGKDREEARRRLIRALKQTQILGLVTNKTFLIQLLREQAFIDGAATTSFIDEEVMERAKGSASDLELALAAVILSHGSGALDNWSNTELMIRTEIFTSGKESQSVKILASNSGYQVTAGDTKFDIVDVNCGDGSLVYTLNEITRYAGYSIDGDQISIDIGERVSNFERVTYKPAESEDAAGSGQILASTEGLVIDILIAPGDRVNKGDALILVEAMKMEHRHLADGNGIVAAVHVIPNQQVKNHQLMVELKLDDGNSIDGNLADAPGGGTS